MATTSHIKVLTPEEENNMFEKCLEFLSKKGVVFRHQEVLKLLDKAGAEVDLERESIKFPRDVIEEALRTVPHSLMLASSDGSRDCVLPHPQGLFYTRNGTGSHLWVDPGTNAYREVMLADVTEWAQLTHLLDDMDFTAIIDPQDVPNETRDIYAVKAIMENTSKHLQVQAFTGESVKYIIEMAIAAVGSAEELSKRPVIDIFCDSTTPYVYKPMDGEILLQLCHHGMPINAQSLPSAGGTSPITIAGTVLVASLEVLALLVMSQMIRPGIPVFGSSSLYTIDMATGMTTPGSIEAILCSAAFVQFVKDCFHVPTYTSYDGVIAYCTTPDACNFYLITIFIYKSNIFTSRGRGRVTHNKPLISTCL